MCTLSFVPDDRGYAVAMNRDESLARDPALPPEIFLVGGNSAVYPREPGGGTWIGSNDSGITLAVLNWYGVKHTRKIRKLQSRGLLIPGLAGGLSLQEIRSRLLAMPLGGTLPFRLVVVSPAEQALQQWRWDGFSLQQEIHPWRPTHWFSSSLSDAVAEQVRSRACRHAWMTASAGTIGWLRRLHASHAAAGPLGICMHRDRAATVSYTEIRCDPATVLVGYRAGHPCGKPELDGQLSLPRATPRFRMIA